MAKKKAHAHRNASFAGCGGKCDPTNGLKPSVGIGSTGSKNVNPPYAKDKASFSGVGGKNTKSKV